MKISVIVPTSPGRPHLASLLDSIISNIDIVIVNNETMSLAEKRNEGARRASGDILLFVDDDNYLSPLAIHEIKILFEEEKEISIAGVTAYYFNDKDFVCDGGSRRNMLTGFIKGLNTNKHYTEMPLFPYEVDEVANAFAIRRSVFFELGGFDSELFPIELDEADFCARARKAGHKIVMCPAAICYHHSQTYSSIPDFRKPKNAYFMGRNRILFQRKHLMPQMFEIYSIFFMPVFVISYCACLLLRRKIGMIKHFLRGVNDGLRNTHNCPKEYRS